MITTMGTVLGIAAVIFTSGFFTGKYYSQPQLSKTKNEWKVIAEYDYKGTIEENIARLQLALQKHDYIQVKLDTFVAGEYKAYLNSSRYGPMLPFWKGNKTWQKYRKLSNHHWSGTPDEVIKDIRCLLSDKHWGLRKLDYWNEASGGWARPNAPIWFKFTILEKENKSNSNSIKIDRDSELTKAEQEVDNFVKAVQTRFSNKAAE